MFVFVSGLFVFGVIWLVFEMFVFRVSELGVLCVLFFSRFPLSSSNLPSFSSFPPFLPLPSFSLTTHITGGFRIEGLKGTGDFRVSVGSQVPSEREEI